MEEACVCGLLAPERGLGGRVGWNSQDRAVGWCEKEGVLFGLWLARVRTRTIDSRSLVGIPPIDCPSLVSGCSSSLAREALW